MRKNKFRTYKQTELLPSLLKEKEIQDSILDYLVAMGFVAIRINSGAFSKDNSRYIRSYIIHNFLAKFTKLKRKSSSGFPDVLALRANKFLLFEVKAGKGGRLSESQIDFIELADIKRTTVHVVNSLDQVIKIVEEFYGTSN